MSQIGVLNDYVSVDGTDFTEALADGFGEIEHLTIPSQKSNAAGVARSIRIWSSVQTSWLVSFYRTLVGRNADANVDGFLGSFLFAAASGRQTGGAGLFRYYVDGLSILCLDDTPRSATTEGGGLHVEIQPVGAAKAVFPTENFRIAIAVEPMGGWG